VTTTRGNLASEAAKKEGNRSSWRLGCGHQAGPSCGYSGSDPMSSRLHIFSNTLAYVPLREPLVGNSQHEDGHVIVSIVLLEVHNGALYTAG
jgi:hypothetical protein